MPRINKTQYAILGCLSIRPMSAYDIKAFMERSTAHFWKESEAQLYPTLKQLQNNHHAEAKEEKAQKFGVRKIYHITQSGQSALRDWLLQPTDKMTYRNEFLLKLFFGSIQPAAANINLIAEACNDCKMTREILQSIKGGLKEKDLSKKRMPYIEITLDYGIDMLTAEINWCQRSLKKLNNL